MCERKVDSINTVERLENGRLDAFHFLFLFLFFTLTPLSLGGGPVMIGGSSDVYSKTVVAVRDQPPELFIWDPHYSACDGEGSPSTHSDAHCADSTSLPLREIWQGGWIAWRPLSVLSETSFYNVAFPLRPTLEGGSLEGRTLESSGPRGPSGAPARPSDWGALIETVSEGNGRLE